MNSKNVDCFVPFLEDQPLSYAYEHADFYRNKAREEKWGSPVYFAPSTYAFNQGGQYGPYYQYNHNASEKLGKFGNCTWYVICRHHENTGEIETSPIGEAGKIFDKYTGRKHGSLSKKINISNFINAGDWLVFTDDLKNSGDGHVAYVEKVDEDKIWVSENGYSTNLQYKDKTCIVYQLEKDKLITATQIVLRPKAPYKKYLYGVVHTGDALSKRLAQKEVDIEEFDNNNELLNSQTITLN